MGGPIVRTGTTPKFWENYDRIFSSGGAKNDKHPKKLFKVSASTEGSCKITISAHTPPPGITNTAGGGGLTTITAGGNERKRKNKEKDFASPSSESKIQVHSGVYLPPSSSTMDGDSYEKCAVSIQFDPNTKKLWQELHYPYGNYTSFFRYNFRDCFFSLLHTTLLLRNVTLNK